MKTPTLILSFAIALAAALPAQAACYAEYRAQRQYPVQLAYGVAEIRGGACNSQNAAAHINNALGQSGWTLTNIVSTMNQNNPPANSGYTSGHYLRF